MFVAFCLWFTNFCLQLWPLPRVPADSTVFHATVFPYLKITIGATSLAPLPPTVLLPSSVFLFLWAYILITQLSLSEIWFILDTVSSPGSVGFNSYMSSDTLYFTLSVLNSRRQSCLYFSAPLKGNLVVTHWLNSSKAFSCLKNGGHTVPPPEFWPLRMTQTHLPQVSTLGFAL